MNIYSFIQMMRSWLQFGFGGIGASYEISGLLAFRPLLVSVSTKQTEAPSVDQLYLMERFGKLARPDEPYEVQSPHDEHMTVSIYVSKWPPNSYDVILGVTEFQRAADIGNINHSTERTFHFTPSARAYSQTRVWESGTGRNGRQLVEDSASTLTYISDAELAEIETALLWNPI